MVVAEVPVGGEACGDTFSSTDVRLSEISSRLLQGWTLLSQPCPVPCCNTPLLRDTKKGAQGEVYCVQCKAYCITPEEAKSVTNKAGNKHQGAASQFTESDSSQRRQQVEQQSKSPPNPTTNTAPPKAMESPKTQMFKSSSTSATAAKSSDECRAGAEERMGEKLLLGWTMLADMCPTPSCNFPLLRDRDSNRVCVSCGNGGNPLSPTQQATVDAPATKEGTHLNNANGSTRRDSKPLVSDTHASIDPERQAGVDDSEDPILSEDEFALVRERRDKLSAAIARFLLQGWKLLDEHCTGDGCGHEAPLLKERSTGRLYCAACETYSGEEGNQGLTRRYSNLAAEENRSVPTQRTANLAAEVSPVQVESQYEVAERARLRKQAAREQASDRTGASTGLGERLLQGWTMLSVSCPTRDCNTPLMRDRQGVISCVSCGTTTVTGSTTENVVQAAGEAVENDHDGKADRDRNMVEDGQVVEACRNILEDDDIAAERIYTKRRIAELTGSGFRAARNTAENAATVPEAGWEGWTSSEHVRIRAKALDTVYRAIDMSERRLHSCTNGSATSVDLEETSRQADLLVKLATAARALVDLQKSNI